MNDNAEDVVKMIVATKMDEVALQRDAEEGASSRRRMDALC